MASEGRNSVRMEVKLALRSALGWIHIKSLLGLLLYLY